MAAGLKISPRWRKAGDPAVGGGGFGDLPVVPTDPRTGRWWRRAWGRPVTVAGPGPADDADRPEDEDPADGDGGPEDPPTGGDGGPKNRPGHGGRPEDRPMTPTGLRTLPMVPTSLRTPLPVVTAGLRTRRWCRRTRRPAGGGGPEDRPVVAGPRTGWWRWPARGPADDADRPEDTPTGGEGGPEHRPVTVAGPGTGTWRRAQGPARVGVPRDRHVWVCPGTGTCGCAQGPAGGRRTRGAGAPPSRRRPVNGHPLPETERDPANFLTRS